MIFHICNNYVSSRVHSDLVHALQETGLDQVVFVPVRDKDQIKKIMCEPRGALLVYILFNNRIRYFPLLKVLYILAKTSRAVLSKTATVQGRPIFIAHNFWSDGMVLFFFSFFRRIEYSLVVRNTDINIFIPRLPHYRWLMAASIRRSKGLIFVSRAHFQRFSENWPSLVKAAKRTAIVPNGVSDFWHDNRVMHQTIRPLQVCFVGKFNENKNLAKLVGACAKILCRRPNLKLVLAGGTADELRQLISVRELPSFIDVRGVVRSQDRLRDIFRNSRVFAMPSFRETFGLVYIEAISQGCAIVCTKQEGIDGLFDSDSVVPVSPESEDEIAEAVAKLLDTHPSGLDISWVETQLRRFRWSEVATRYLEMTR